MENKYILSYDTKAKITGDKITIISSKKTRTKTFKENEISEYNKKKTICIENSKEKNISRNLKKLRNNVKENITQHNERQKSSLYRSISTLRDTIDENYYFYKDTTSFITFTFKNVNGRSDFDIKYVKKEMEKFFRRAKRYFGFRMKYVWVKERGTRGTKRLHVHAVIFNIPFIENLELQKLWGNGFVKINRIGQMNGLGAYVTKYMTKEFVDNECVKGEKLYYCSKGLLKPKFLYSRGEQEKIEMLNRIKHQFKDCHQICTIVYPSDSLDEVTVEILKGERNR